MADETKSDDAEPVEAVAAQAEEAEAEQPKEKAVEKKAAKPKVEKAKTAKKSSADAPPADTVSATKTDESKTITDLADLGSAAQAKAEEAKAEEAKAVEAAAVDATEAAADSPASDDSKTLTDLADLGGSVDVPVEAPVYVQRLDQQGRAYATGKRKDAVARVWIKPGPGRIVVNERDIEVFFARPVLRMVINQPFEAVDRSGQFDVMCTVKGGGLSGQAGAVRHGISKALLAYEPTLRPALKSGGFLTRDSRVVERKKYGKAKARRSFQFSKR